MRPSWWMVSTAIQPSDAAFGIFPSFRSMAAGCKVRLNADFVNIDSGAAMRLTPKVKEILSWYEGENPGVKGNLARLLMEGRLAGTGKLVILPVDQGYEHGPARSFAPNPAPTTRTISSSWRWRRGSRATPPPWARSKRVRTPMPARCRDPEAQQRQQPGRRQPFDQAVTARSRTPCGWAASASASPSIRARTPATPEEELRDIIAEARPGLWPWSGPIRAAARSARTARPHSISCLRRAHGGADGGAHHQGEAAQGRHRPRRRQGPYLKAEVQMETLPSGSRTSCRPLRRQPAGRVLGR